MKHPCPIFVWLIIIAKSLLNIVILEIAIITCTKNHCEYSGSLIASRAIVCIAVPDCLLLFIIGAYGVVLKCRHKVRKWVFRRKYPCIFKLF